MSFICLLPTPEGLCWNCGDEGILLRGETPILNAEGLTFCDPRCADQFDTREEAKVLNPEWCPSCGFDRHEHSSDCPKNMEIS